MPMLNAAKPSCQRTSWARNSGKVSRSHLEELPFNNWTAFETEIVAGKLKSKCTWSAMPPTASARIPFSRAMPPKYGHRRLQMAGVRKGRRSLVEKTQCMRQVLNECISVPSPGDFYCFLGLIPSTKVLGYFLTKTLKCCVTRVNKSVPFCLKKQWR
jgi:hypothetical protein